MTTVRLSSKNQMVLPREAREGLGVGPGDELLVVLRRGHIIILPKPANFVEALCGSGRGLYRPNADAYLKRERRSWTRRKYRKR